MRTDSVLSLYLAYKHYKNGHSPCISNSGLELDVKLRYIAFLTTLLCMMPSFSWSNSDLKSALEQLINPTQVKKISIGEYMSKVVIPSINGEVALSSHINPEVQVKGMLIIFKDIIDVDREREAYVRLVEAGIWDSGTVIYNFRKTAMIFPDFSGGLGDTLTILSKHSLSYLVEEKTQCSTLLAKVR